MYIYFIGGLVLLLLISVSLLFSGVFVAKKKDTKIVIFNFLAIIVFFGMWALHNEYLGEIGSSFLWQVAIQMKNIYVSLCVVILSMVLSFCFRKRKTIGIVISLIPILWFIVTLILLFSLPTPSQIHERQMEREYQQYLTEQYELQMQQENT